MLRVLLSMCCALWFLLPTEAKAECANMNDARRCLLCNCYHESRGESHAGIVAVGRVVTSRVQSPAFPNSVCGVIKDRGQFSWWSSSSKRNARMSDKAGVAKCQKAIDDIVKKSTEFYGLYYHTTGVSPKWARGCQRVEKIGVHIFYRDCSYKQHASKNLRPAGGIE